MNNIALGRYMPLNSVVHKMDPRAKIMILLFLMIAVFIPAGVWGYVLLSLFILAALFLSKLQLSFALRAYETNDLDDGISFGHQCFSYKNWNTLV